MKSLSDILETYQKISKLLSFKNSILSSPIALRKSELISKFQKSGIIEAASFLERVHQSTTIISTVHQLKKTIDTFRSNPELEFIKVSELELLNEIATKEFMESLNSDEIDELISDKEDILEEFLMPYLQRLQIDNLWVGATIALNTTNNPDRIRQALISLRTLLEFLIDHELAPKSELLKLEMFKKEFAKFKKGKEKLEMVRIKRSKKINFFMSKIQFGIFDEFTEKDINFICSCYETLCEVHNAKLELSENQARVLKVKTGITVWLLAYVNEIIKKQNLKMLKSYNSPAQDHLELH